jgi:hypothetical protein
VKLGAVRHRDVDVADILGLVRAVGHRLQACLLLAIRKAGIGAGAEERSGEAHQQGEPEARAHNDSDSVCFEKPTNLVDIMNQ